MYGYLAIVFNGLDSNTQGRYGAGRDSGFFVSYVYANGDGA
ncbi:hypothetical protein [uncultured Deefgea sp.]|nr:hypothetical protein [uncultured Deefgea sp.]